MAVKKEISLQELINARNKCADIVARRGERYLPIFERLEREIKMKKRRQEMLDKAVKISIQNSIQNRIQN